MSISLNTQMLYSQDVMLSGCYGESCYGIHAPASNHKLDASPPLPLIPSGSACPHTATQHSLPLYELRCDQAPVPVEVPVTVCANREKELILQEIKGVGCRGTELDD